MVILPQMSLKKGGADKDVIRALRFLLATPEELQKTERAGQSTGQWVSDILEYRQMPTAMTPFNYITLSDATELRVQEVSSPVAVCKPTLDFSVCILLCTSHGSWCLLFVLIILTRMVWQITLELGYVGKHKA